MSSARVNAVEIPISLARANISWAAGSLVLSALDLFSFAIFRLY
jgi:hypothetical protein